MWFATIRDNMKLNDATKKNQTELNEQETETIKAQFYKKKKKQKQ